MMGPDARLGHTLVSLAHKAIPDLLTWVDEQTDSPLMPGSVARLSDDLYAVAESLNRLMGSDVNRHLLEGGRCPVGDNPTANVVSLANRAARVKVPHNAGDSDGHVNHDDNPFPRGAA